MNTNVANIRACELLLGPSKLVNFSHRQQFRDTFNVRKCWLSPETRTSILGASPCPALVNLVIYSKLRGCDLKKRRIANMKADGSNRPRSTTTALSDPDR